MDRIKIYFQYKEELIYLPVAPSELTIARGGNNENTEVVGLGEINVIRNKRLIPLTIESFFPEENNPQTYIDFFIKIQDEKQPVRVICQEFKINMLMSIDAFEYSVRAGEEGDRYYTLELMEWIDYKPKIITEEKKTSERQEENSSQQEKQDELKEVSEKKESKNKGDIVQFHGGNHYHTSQDDKPTGKPRTAGNAKITLTAPNTKHPYHLIGTEGGSDVYGWVDEGTFS